MQTLKQLLAKKELTEDRNIPFTQLELQKEAEQNPRFKLINEYDNRKVRRSAERIENQKFARPIINNRRKTKARKDNRLFQKMSRFYLAITSRKRSF